MLKVLSNIGKWIGSKVNSGGLKSDAKVTLLDSAGVAVYGDDVLVLNIPSNLVIRGAVNIFFEDNVRIHGKESMSIEANKVVSMNSPLLKDNEFFSKEKIDAYFATLIELSAANAKKMIEDQKIVPNEHGTPPENECCSCKSCK